MTRLEGAAQESAPRGAAGGLSPSRRSAVGRPAGLGRAGNWGEGPAAWRTTEGARFPSLGALWTSSAGSEGLGGHSGVAAGTTTETQCLKGGCSLWVCEPSAGTGPCRVHGEPPKLPEQGRAAESTPELRLP